MIAKLLLLFLALLVRNGGYTDFKITPVLRDSKGADLFISKKNPRKASKNKPKTAEDSKACKPPKQNLIVVNFTTDKFTVYVNDKKAATVKAQDQFSFKYILPVGNVRVQIQNSAKQVIYEEEYNVVSQGKQTCKINQTIILR